MTILFRLLIALSIAAGIFFVFFGINHTFGLDEAVSVDIATAALKDIAPTATYNTGTPPLYYFLLAFWIKLFGISEPATRTLSGLFYLLSLPAIYFLGKLLYDQKAGLLSSFLFLVSPIAIRQSQNTRMYSLLGLLTILSLLYFFKLFYLKSTSKSDLTKYILATAAGTFTHYWFFFIFLAQIICYFLLFRGPTFKKFLAAAGLSIVPFLFWTPLFFAQAANRGAYWWVSKPDVYVFISSFLGFYGEGKQAWLMYGALISLFFFEGPGFKLRLQKLAAVKDLIVQNPALALLLLSTVSLLIPWTISQAMPIFPPHKYTIIALPSFAVFLGLLSSRLGHRVLLLIFCYVLLGGAVAGYAYKKTRFHQYTDKSTADYLIKTAASGDVFIFGGSSRAALEYYLSLRKSDKYFLKTSFPAEMEKHTGWSNPAEMLSKKPGLEKEADSLVNYLSALLQNKKTKVWYIYGFYPEIEGILKSKLDRHLQLVQENIMDHPYYTFYDRISVYQKSRE